MGLRIVDCVEIDDGVASTACAFYTRIKVRVDGVLVAKRINMSRHPRTLACWFHLRRVSLWYPVVRLV